VAELDGKWSRERLVKFTNISQDVQKLELAPAPAPVLAHAVPTPSHPVVVKKLHLIQESTILNVQQTHLDFF
jgi:hypothetical protein